MMCRSLRFTSFALLALASLAACGGSSSGPGTTGQPRGAYPAGPYGKTEGSTIEPLSFTTAEGAMLSLEDVWKDESKTLLTVITSAGWCTSCIEEQPQLKQLHGTYASKGLFLMESIFEDAAFQPATTDLAASWKRQHALPFDVVADPAFQLGSYYNRELTPMNLIVDVTTMKILRISTGSDPNALEAIYSARLD